MRTEGILKTVCAVGLAASCAWVIAGCSSGAANAGLTGGVAATVNGTEILEDDVTRTINVVRANNAVETEEAWGQYLAENSLTPEAVRESIVDSYVQRELLKQGAAERGVTVDGSEIDTHVDQMKSNYDSDGKWKTALVQAGFDTEDKYRDMLETNLLNEKLVESFVPEEDPSDEEVLDVVATYVSAYDGAKRSSHILFDSDDEATAQSVLDQINSGSLDFAEAAELYSQDGSGAEGGDVGWDKLTTFVDEYQSALDDLGKDEVSGLVTSDYGIHIIKCTDVFTAPEEVTDLDQLPAEFVEAFKTLAAQQKQSEAYQAWFTEYKTNADIVVNDMPEGLPYAVDMSKYQTDDGDSGAADDPSSGSDDSAGDGASEDGDAQDQAA